ncbi:MAG TPA: penicillin-binding protein, partial [Roseiarcus sp.]|nr:penicillin-binding protein [Roseiarcus sp.]
LVAGVWLGNDDGSPTKKTSGGNLPVEIWSRFMKAALQGVPPAGLPSGVWKPATPLDAPLAPPANIASVPPLSDAPRGQPMVINRAAEAAAAPAQPATIPVRSNVLLPPAPIPNAGAPRVVPRKEKSFLDKLFGGA